MPVFGKLKSLYPVIVFSVVFLVCLVLYRPFNLAEQNHKSWVTKAQSSTGSRKLVQALRRACMEDRTVILTIITQAWAGPGSLLDLFLESFRIGQGTKRLLSHLLIVCVDGQAFQHCKSKHRHCFHLATRKPFVNKDHLRLSWSRIQLLTEVLELGYSVVYTDADVMWLRNPLPHFNPLGELSIARDTQSNRVDVGFFFAKSNDITLQFFKYWSLTRVLLPNHNVQTMFEIIEQEDIFQMLGARIKYLDPAYFSGLCQPIKEMNKVCIMHANCCDGEDCKIHELRLVLDKWRNFTLYSEGEI